MARNEEKSQSMLNRWVSMRIGATLASDKPSRIPEQVTQVKHCEYWRRKFIKDINEKVAVVQNPALGEHRLRDLNDEINHLFRAKLKWEKRILELNGPNYIGQKLGLEDEGQTIAVAGETIRFFGAAKNLPGIKELFENKKQEELQQAKHHTWYAGVDATYYGFKDDDDGLLEQLEHEAEQKAREEEIKKSAKSKASVPSLMAKVPSEEQVEKFIVEKRKQLLLNDLNKYVTITN